MLSGVFGARQDGNREDVLEGNFGAGVPPRIGAVGIVGLVEVQNPLSPRHLHIAATPVGIRTVCGIAERNKQVVLIVFIAVSE